MRPPNHGSARHDADTAAWRALVEILTTQIYAATFSPGDRVRVLEVPADWTGHTGTVRDVYAAGPWPVAVDLDATPDQPTIRAHLAPDQITHVRDLHQPQGEAP